MDEQDAVNRKAQRSTPYRVAEGIVSFFSGEYLLERCGWPNGGTVVFVRAIHVSVFVYATALVLNNVVDPARTGPATWIEFRRQLIAGIPWFGTIFAGSYAALYARFANQWAYLAGVYNQIKAAESRDNVNRTRIAEWKAGFIEDAHDLHLLRKKMFMSIALVWLTSKEVQRCLTSYTQEGQKLLATVAREVGLHPDKLRQTSESTAPRGSWRPRRPEGRK